MAVSPDRLYEKQREQLLPYEDARFAALTAGVPDYYGPQPTDYTLYGSLLRAVAMELARLDYDYSYDIVSLEPQYLTPPDVKRRWAAPLFLGKSYPNPSQFDIDFRNTVVGLLQAYPGGSTLETLEAIVEALTGQSVPVLELYKLIGNGIYNDSDRNTLAITMDVSALTGTNPLAGMVAADKLATLAQSLSTAIDLAKPAHVGFNFTMTFGSGEDFSSRIHGITDQLTLIYNGVEAAPLPQVFTEAPQEDATSPDSTLAGGEAPTDAQGVLAPQLNQAWEIKSDTLNIYRLS